MATSQATAWYHQAYSDREAARRCLIVDDPSTYCQAIAKHQQAVEKATKAVFASLMIAGIARLDIGFTHTIDRLLNALEHLPSTPLNKVVADFAIYEVGSEGKHLMSLAPRRPQVGDPLPRNTEYPYNNEDNSWRSPAEEGSFSLEEVAQFDVVSQRVLAKAKRIMDAIRLLPRTRL